MSSAAEIRQRAGAKAWQRHTPRERLARFAAYLAAVAVIVWSATTLDIHWPFVLDAPAQVADLADRMVPPDWPYFLQIIAPMVETINIATLGTILGAALSVPVALLAAQNTTVNQATLWLARVIVVGSRSVNELVWALLFGVVFGPGPTAGMVAIAVSSVGFTSKLIAEGIEEIDEGQVDAIRATGAGRGQVLIYGVLPQVMPTIIGVLTFRWDINIRQSSIIGLVGAGGIGITLNNQMNSFAWDNVTVILIAIFAVVMASEWVSAKLRARAT
ncbi:phosphonate ABC transporter, permease protein PhnE [Sediminicurvatus halobius]|uniref:Phosphonate ABC transporter, permease protein PhnE n=1 Tax=Sediminicurvatus halobius TaxID=2182432 RepID=A0A2U2N7L0_9GAMM|nr:phosphonate ABC transporter, permease protein PhnE [Spiribacter halobius]PWG65110.1 phosphonate ABC transporter, permease protein PhnE [Spiribacter halobius]UEX78940.1 phosphonate ABC transporter, permease protein PhnE [Spiribacter halobius]